MHVKFSQPIEYINFHPRFLEHERYQRFVRVSVSDERILDEVLLLINGEFFQCTFSSAQLVICQK
mgnify:FL=1